MSDFHGDGPGGLRLYNTLTRQKQAFAPIDAGNVRMYVCGPTVYDYAHIGNARPVIVFDVLFRLLRHLYGDDHVTYVRNITDVDDKINARALRDYADLPLNEAIRKVTEKTANQFHADVQALGCLEPTHEPRATDFILPRDDGKTDMVSLIQTLIKRGKAYVATGESGTEVLFDTAAMADYGALSKRKLDEQQAGARVAVEAHKKKPGDFVLWKQSAPDEPGWEAEFDGQSVRGRPGWHIECSAMSAAYLGETFDIHGGGLDLIFPHHENEIAQSRCAHGTDAMANVWMHNGYLEVEGRKMSKSEGNFITIQDLLETDKFGGRKWPGEVLRLAMLMTHYRQPIDWKLSSLDEAEKTLDRWSTLALGAEYAAPPKARIVEALSDDLNTPKAIAELHRLAREAGDDKGWARRELLGSMILLGFTGKFESRAEFAERLDASETSHVEMLIAARAAARAEKNWAEADRIRDELDAMGIAVMDAKNPETGEIETTWEVKR